MNKSIHKERVGTALKLIASVKAQSRGLGNYLENHIIINDKEESVKYTGDNDILKYLMTFNRRYSKK